jgi:hypothetical protein
MGAFTCNQAALADAAAQPVDPGEMYMALVKAVARNGGDLDATAFSERSAEVICESFGASVADMFRDADQLAYVVECHEIQAAEALHVALSQFRASLGFPGEDIANPDSVTCELSI